MRILWAFLALMVHVEATPLWQSIAPYSGNPFYWEHNGVPKVFFGASDDDNIFQYDEPDLVEQLDRLVAAGGNQLRNTMSSRDEGNIQPHMQLASGIYDLNQWNPEYWDKFERLLELTEVRGIIVQIELWDRFDYHASFWLDSSYNPANNINYTTTTSALEESYPLPGYTETNPFLQTVPGLQNNTVVLPFQEAFVREVVRIASAFDNVLFCISNETRLPEEWSHYWADVVADEAALHGRAFPITEMLDSHFVTKPIHERTILDDTGRFGFADISQNTWQRDDTNWENAQYVRQLLSPSPKPINTTKIYGKPGGVGSRQITDVDAVNNFWRNLLGGFATNRFHRPSTHGIGLSEKSIAQLRIARALLGQYRLIDAAPDSSHARLLDRADAEAYLSYIDGEKWVLFFPAGGAVQLLSGVTGGKRIRWADLGTGEWTKSTPVTGASGSVIPVSTPTSGSWLAVIENTPSSSFDYNVWKQLNFTPQQVSDPSISGPDAAPGGDGTSNALKHLSGIGPYEPLPISYVAKGLEPTGAAFEFSRNIDTTSNPMRIEVATSLGAWTADEASYHLEVVGIIEGTPTLPARELIRISPPAGTSPSQWFVRLLAE